MCPIGNRRRTKGQTIIYEKLHRTSKIEQQEPTKTMGGIKVPRKGREFLLH